MSFESIGAQRAYRMGDTGENVQAIQLGLREAGYALKGTGWYGPATETAVSTLERRAGLEVDGRFGKEAGRTLDALLQGGGPPAALRTPFQEINRPLWLEAGLPLIGLREGAGSADNQQIIDWAKDEGGAIAGEYTHDSIPWCALLANHILTKVGLKGTETLWALDFAGKWPSVQLSGPAVGAFAPMLRNGGGHIICVVGRDQHGNVMGLGGNQGDAVSVAPFATSRLNKGFWWPKDVPAPAQVGFSTLPIVRSDGSLSTNEA